MDGRAEQTGRCTAPQQTMGYFPLGVRPLKHNAGGGGLRGGGGQVHMSWTSAGQTQNSLKGPPKEGVNVAKTNRGVGTDIHAYWKE